MSTETFWFLFIWLVAGYKANDNILVVKYAPFNDFGTLDFSVWSSLRICPRNYSFNWVIGTSRIYLDGTVYMPG